MFGGSDSGKFPFMKRRIPCWQLIHSAVLALFVLASGSISAPAEAPSSAIAAFNAYAGKVEFRLAQEHRSAAGFLANVKPGSRTDVRLRRGELIIEKLGPENDSQPKGALIHDWRGTAFIPGATPGSFETLMKSFSTYPKLFAPQVMQARILAPHAKPVPDHFTATMRIRQKHVITVVMDTTYDVSYGRLDAQHGYSISRSTNIHEIDDAGSSKEHALAPDKEHGFLWRLNTYWSYEERNGGLYIQIESISLTRGIPAGLGWAIGPYVESVPRESLEFTLHSTCDALQKSPALERGAE